MSVEVKTPTHTQFEHSEFLCGEKQSNSKPKPSPVTFKFDDNHHGNFQRRPSEGSQYLSSQWRKRRFSTHKPDNTYHQQGFRRKRFKSTPGEIVLPTKFLLGGNINDPLNLNSINEDENDKTPYSSPVPTPAHRKEPINSVPFNITDPLNLESTDDDLANKSGKKKKRNKRRHESFSAGSQVPKEHVPSEKRKNLMEALKIEIDEVDIDTSPHANTQNFKELTFKLDSSSNVNKIVSPVIPQMSPSFRPKKRKRCLSTSDIKPDTNTIIAKTVRTSLSPSRNIDSLKPRTPKPTKKQNQKPSSKSHKDPKKFIHGNYNRYYGYRNPEAEDDSRKQCFKQEWFENKDVLDIGCNVGHLTLSLARDFNPSKVVGVDIDKTLISAARKNIRHYLSSEKLNTKTYPVSNMVNYGPICGPPVTEKSPKQGFPYNITFVQGNYVLNSDELVNQQKEEYDVILALSVTKWIHLNNGDQGLKRFFRRIYNHLRPGGRLILEPQPWSSYKKKKKLTDDIFRCFQTIRLKPQQFSDFLLREVGFSTCEVVDVPFHKSKGFRRPIQLYTKPDTVTNTPKSTDYSTVNTPAYDHSTTNTPAYDHSTTNTPAYDHSSVNTPAYTSGINTPASTDYINTPAYTDEDPALSHEHPSNVPTPQSSCYQCSQGTCSCSCSPSCSQSPYIGQEVVDDSRGSNSNNTTEFENSHAESVETSNEGLKPETEENDA